MTLSRQLTKRIYAGNGVTRAWEVDFPLLSANDLHIYITSPGGEETAVTENFEWDANTNKIIYPLQTSGQDPLAEGWTITLVRQTPLTQEIDLLRQGELDAEVIESGYDKLTMLVQELSEKVDRSIKYPVSAQPSGLETENFLHEIVTAKQAALTASNQAVLSAQTASASAASAADSATAAGGYAGTATAKAGEAAISATSAAASAASAAASVAVSIPLTQKAVANGVATLDANAQVPLPQLPVDDALSTVSENPVQNKAISNPLIYATKYVQGKVIEDMQTQEVVDATELVTATGAIQAVDLDLSANDIITKLTAKGTSGALANLSSVLVSNEASFDNATSPQIDASYTGLNRTALVNLFNSLPYNVGYNVVGSPTITSGVASGFTNSNYLVTPISADFKDVTGFIIKIKPTTANTSVAQYVFSGLGTGGSNAAYIRISQSNIYFTSRSTDATFVSNYVLNTWYWLKYTNDGTEQKFYYSTDGINYTLSATRNIQYVDNGDTRPLYFGRTSWGSGDEYSFAGEIDLKNTVFQINHFVWFRGDMPNGTYT